MRIYACTVHVYPCPKTRIDWSSCSQAFVPAVGPAGRASTARAKQAAQKQVSNGSNAWIGGSLFGWHIHIQLGRHITCNDFRGWNLEDHFSIQLYSIWTLGHNCVRLRLLWADFVWLRIFDLYQKNKKGFAFAFLLLHGVFGPVSWWSHMISMLPTTATEIFSGGAICPKETDKTPGPPWKRDSWISHQQIINIVDFSILDIKNFKKKETKKPQAPGVLRLFGQWLGYLNWWDAMGLQRLCLGRCSAGICAGGCDVWTSQFLFQLRVGENRWRSIQFLLDFLLEVMVKADLETGSSWVGVHGREVEAIQVLEEKAGQIRFGDWFGVPNISIFLSFEPWPGFRISRFLGFWVESPQFFQACEAQCLLFSLLRTTQLGHFGVWVRYPKTPKWDQSICGSNRHLLLLIAKNKLPWISPLDWHS